MAHAADEPLATPSAIGHVPRVMFPLALLAFISLGLPDGTLGVAWPSIQASFGLPISGLGMLLLAGTVGYLTSSSQSGHLLARFGVGRLLFGSTLLSALAAFGFAALPVWPLLVLMAIIGGLGAGAIDAGTNAYAAAHFSAARITWLHASYGVGAATGPLVMSAVVERGLAWQWGYLVVALVLSTMASIFWRTRANWTDKQSEATATSGERLHNIRDAMRVPAVWMNIVLFVCYTGLESTAGQWAFSLLTIERGWNVQLAGIATSLYWGSLTAGRIAFGVVAHRLTATTILRIGMALAPVAAGLLLLAHPTATFAGLGLLGFALAPIFPCLIAETPGRVGSHLAAHAISLEVSASYLGIAGIPSLVGVLAKRHGLEIVGPWLLIASLLMIVLHELALALDRRRKHRASA